MSTADGTYSIVGFFQTAEAERNRRDADWLRQEIITLANYSILVRPVTPSDMRRAMLAIHAGRPWRGVLR